jgi:hypothetical protein
MGALVGKIIAVALQLLAGVGVGAVMDKVAADKLPGYPAGGVSPHQDGGELNIPKIIYFLIAGVIGALAWNFISRKLKIKF